MKQILKSMKLNYIACCLNICCLCCVCNLEEKPHSEKAIEYSSDLDYDDGWDKSQVALCIVGIYDFKVIALFTSSFCAGCTQSTCIS